MNPNNYKQLSDQELINILEGSDDRYIMGPMQALAIEYGITLPEDSQTYESEPSNVCISTYPERDKNLVKSQYTAQLSQEEWPDFAEPIVYQITKAVLWNRKPKWPPTQNLPQSYLLGIDLFNCEFTTSLAFQNINSSEHLLIHNCYFPDPRPLKEGYDTSPYGSLFIKESQFKTVELNGVSAKLAGKHIPLQTIKFQNLESDHLRIVDVVVQNLQIYCATNSLKKITISNSKVDNLFIKGEEFESIDLASITSQGEISFRGKCKEFSISGEPALQEHLGYPKTSVRRVSLHLSNQPSKGYFLCKYLNVHQLVLTGTNNSDVLIEDCQLNKLAISEFTNYGNVGLHRLPDLFEVDIHESSIGKTEFLDVDLPKAYHTRIINSNVMDILMISTEFPNTLVAAEKNDYKGIREAFRQLKLASSKQGNRFQELKYEAYEMDAYKKDHTARKTWGDKIILYFNWITNNYGQNWLLAASELLLFFIPFYMALKCYLGYVWVLGWPSAQDSSQYLEVVINPLHNFNAAFEPDGTLPSEDLGIAKLIDIFIKFFSGLLLFQLVRAFRKYVK